MKKKKIVVRKQMSVPMKYYQNAFLKHKVHRRVKDLKNKKDFRSMSDTVEYLLNNLPKSKQ